MKTKYIIPLLLLIGYLGGAQESNVQDVEEEAGTRLPEHSTFQLGKNIEGLIQNTVNESTGKVMFSVPITKLQASTAVQYPVALQYNGEAAMKQAKNTNEFNPTSVVGVGFSMSVPRIVADYKQTAARDDDDFYLIFGNANKLKCIRTANDTLEFVTENYEAWKITYYKKQLHNDGICLICDNNYKTRYSYWEVIKEDGTIYQFGNKENPYANMYVSTWGNWIGDTVEHPEDHMAVEWYLHAISDQWKNTLTFYYQTTLGIQNPAQQTGPLYSQIVYPHTEAIYLTSIRSSQGERVNFTYEDKLDNEYFEPHTEQAEPDAYQEKYEKKYLKDIQIYNANNELIQKNVLEYELKDPDIESKTKRYLKELRLENGAGESLPSQKFEYHNSGDFKGNIKKIIFPAGGSVSYTYKKQFLFHNSARNIDTIDEPGTTYVVVKNKYIAIQKDKVEHYQWINNNWRKIRVHDFDDYSVRTTHRDTEYIYSENYYAIVTRRFEEFSLYIAHLSADGVSWKGTTFEFDISEEPLGSYWPDYYYPIKIMNGDEFIAIGAEADGKLHTFVLENDQWTRGVINHDIPASNRNSFVDKNVYYEFASGQNFIIVVDKIGGRDIVDGSTNNDNYYVHYLDTDKEWISKSWTQDAVQNIDYPITDNFHLDIVVQKNRAVLKSWNSRDNPVSNFTQRIFRWNSDYSLKAIDLNLNDYAKRNRVQASGDMLLVSNSYKSRPSAIRFDGNSWVSSPIYEDDAYNYSTYDQDIFSTVMDEDLYCSVFSPNTNSWKYSFLEQGNTNNRIGFLGDYIFSSKYIYKKSDKEIPIVLADEIPAPSDLSNYIHSFSSNSYLYLERHISTNNEYDSRLYFRDMETGNLSFSILETSDIYFSTPFSPVSDNSLYVRPALDFNDEKIYKIIEGNVDSDVYDTVVDTVVMDNDSEEERIQRYTFEDFNFLINESTYYGKTTLEHKGYGNDSKGKIIKYFDTGLTDMRLLGRLNKIENRDVNGNLKKESIITYTIFPKYTEKTSGDLVLSSYIRNSNVEDNTYLESGVITVTKEVLYNDIGLPIETIDRGSNGETTVTLSTYGFESTIASQAALFKNRNMLNQPIATQTYVDGVLISKNEIKWREQNNVLYPYQNWGGTGALKLLKETTKMDAHGIVMEERAHNGIYSVILMGYDSKYPVAGIGNARYDEVMEALDVSYEVLQEMDTSTLKATLLQLYDKLPKATFSFTFYDSNGNITNKIDARKEEMFYSYDAFNRVLFVSDAQGNKLYESEYHYKS